MNILSSCIDTGRARTRILAVYRLFAQAALVLVGTAAYVAFMFLAVRPTVKWLTQRFDRGRL